MDGEAGGPAWSLAGGDKQGPVDRASYRTF